MKSIIGPAFLAVACLFFAPESVFAFDGPAKINDVYVVHFVLDGLNKSMFDKTLAKGLLPNIEKQFVENGAVFTHGLSLFPSTSTTVYQAYTTGLMPGNSGIPHLEKFDRENQKVIGYLTAGGFAKINTDFFNLKALTNPSSASMDSPSTIFELLKGYPTASIYSSFNRGASYAFPKKAPFRAMWYTFVTHSEEKVDVLAMRKVMKMFSRGQDKIPRYALVGLYSADILGHKYGPLSEEVSDVLVQFDRFIRDFINLLKERGILEKTYIIISADHGMHAGGELFDFEKALKGAGVAVKKKNPRDKNYSLYAANRGVASSQIYVRHEGSFEPIEDPEVLRHHPRLGGGEIDLVDFISNLPATDLLVVRAGERGAEIFGGGGKKGQIACYTINMSDYCSYRYDTQSGDPLGYDKNPELKDMPNSSPHSTIEWRDRTAGEFYPDAVTALSQIFHDGRAGDAFITTKDLFSFRKMKAGNHGGAAESDMRVPLLISGPGIGRQTFAAARATDIYPLILEWFGINIPEDNYDGRNPFKKHETDKNSEALAGIEEAFDEGNPKSNACSAIIRGNGANLAGVKKIAKDELDRREKLSDKLGNLIARLEAQKTNPRAPKIAAPEYVDDHIAIAKRTLEWTSAGVSRMGRMLDVCNNSQI